MSSQYSHIFSFIVTVDDTVKWLMCVFCSFVCSALQGSPFLVIKSMNFLWTAAGNTGKVDYISYLLQISSFAWIFISIEVTNISSSDYLRTSSYPLYLMSGVVCVSCYLLLLFILSYYYYCTIELTLDDPIFICYLHMSLLSLLFYFIIPIPGPASLVVGLASCP